MYTRIGKPMAAAWLAVMTSLSAQAQTPVTTAETVIVKRETQLRQSPAENAPALAPLAAKTQVTRLLARSGPWIEVRTPQGVNGWIHMFDVSTMAPAQGGNFATGALRGLTGLFGGGNSLAPTRSATSTVGIRGLGAEDITNTQPNLTAVTMVEALRLDVAQARQFGTVAALVPQMVEPLPVPPRPQQPAGSNTGGGQVESQR